MQININYVSTENALTAFNSSDFPNSLSCLLNPELGSAIDLEHLIDLNISVHSMLVTASMYAMVNVVEREIPARLMAKRMKRCWIFYQNFLLLFW